MTLLAVAILGCAGGRASSVDGLSSPEAEMIEVSLDFARKSKARDTGDAPPPDELGSPAVHYVVTADARRPKGDLRYHHTQRVEFDGPTPAWNAGSTGLGFESEHVVVRRVRWTGRADRALDVRATGSARGEDLWWHGVTVGEGAHSGSARRSPGPTVRGPGGFACERCRLVGATLQEHGAALLTVEGPLDARDLWVLGSTGHLRVSGPVELSEPLLVLESGPLFQGAHTVSLRGGLVLVPEGAEAEVLVGDGEVSLEGTRVLPLSPERLGATLAAIDAAWSEGRAPTRTEVEATLLP